MYPTGTGVGPSPSLTPPRGKLPVGLNVNFELWLVHLQFRRDITTTYEQIIQHMVSFCKDKIKDECGLEKEITLPTIYFDRPQNPIKVGVTETDIFLFTEMIKRLGAT